jgi:hypothetical protein
MKFNIVKQFYRAIADIKYKKAQKHKSKYKKITSVDELKKETLLDYHDLSELDLHDYKDLFMYIPQTSMRISGISGWTTNVIWPSPDKMPKGFNPNKILEQAKYTQRIDATGKGINIAVIDNMLDITNPEYAENIKYFQPIKEKGILPNKHASMVMGNLCGKNTGIAPDVNVYFFSKLVYQNRNSNNKELCDILRNVIEFNSKQPKGKKIHILSCSWGVRKQYSPEVCELLSQLQSNGVKIILCSSNDDKNNSYTLSGRDFMPCNNPNMTDIQPDIQNEETVNNLNKLYQNEPDKIIGIPTNMKTTPLESDGWQYRIFGGESSSAPYIAGVYACALEGNQLFMTRPNWQSELNDILKSTATITDDNNYIINPKGIREQVSQIVKQMELSISKTNLQQTY